MKTTDNFKKTIEEHLKFTAFQDPLFAKTLQKKNKNIDDCITYILNTVKSSSNNGFEDNEIFNMAVHYYDEDDLKPGGKIDGNVIVNHQVKLTAEEIEETKQKAREQIISEERNKMLKKKTVKKTDSKKEVKNPTTLF